MVFNNSWIFHTHNMCTCTNNNFCWFTKSITKPKHGFGSHWFTKRIQHINRLEQLHCIDQRFSNQFVSIPHLELVEAQTTPIVIRQKTTYQLVMWPNWLILGLGERSQGSTFHIGFGRKLGCWNCNLFLLLTSGTLI